MLNYTIKDLELIDVYKLISNTVTPRPIAWISTLSSQGVLNLAPFSYFTPLSSKPATLLISIGHKADGTPKDTLKNLRETKKCSIVIAMPQELKALNDSANPLDYNNSEFSTFNIESKAAEADFPAIPKSAKIALFCEYYKEVELEGSKTIPTIVEVKKVFVDDSLILDKEPVKINIERPTLARVGKEYFDLGKKLEI